jgi:hypothetical protein
MWSRSLTCKERPRRALEIANVLAYLSLEASKPSRSKKPIITPEVRRAWTVGNTKARKCHWGQGGGAHRLADVSAGVGRGRNRSQCSGACIAGPCSPRAREYAVLLRRCPAANASRGPTRARCAGRSEAGAPSRCLLRQGCCLRNRRRRASGRCLAAERGVAFNQDPGMGEGADALEGELRQEDTLVCRI